MDISQNSFVLLVLTTWMGTEKEDCVRCKEQTGLLYGFFFVWCDFSHFSFSPCRGEQGWLLEENSLLKSQPWRLQEELREAKEECSRHDE